MTTSRKNGKRPEKEVTARGATNIDQLVGQRLRARRLEIGMSQEHLADLLGITFQQVQKYEKGVNRVAVGRLLDIAVALEISPGSFLDGLAAVELNGGAGLAETALATPEGHKLMCLFATIKNPRVRKRVLDLAEAVVENSN